MQDEETDMAIVILHQIIIQVSDLAFIFVMTCNLTSSYGDFIRMHCHTGNKK